MGPHAGELPTVSAVVVLGYRLNPDGSPSPLLAQRTRHATALAAKHRVPLIFSGGVPARHNHSEAEAMQSLSRQWQRSGSRRRPRAEWLEQHSRSTRENALFTLDLLRARRPAASGLLVVTNLFHARRACAVFARAAAASAQSARLSIGCVAMPPSLEADAGGSEQPRVTEVGWCVGREALALLYYGLRGWL